MIDDGDIGDLAQYYGECADRADDLRPATDLVHKAYLNAQRKFLMRHPVGHKTGQLDDSLTGGANHVWNMHERGYEAGSAVPYADAYATIQGREIIDTSDEVIDKLSDVISHDYIFAGEGI